jgi:hypothetical protein
MKPSFISVARYEDFAQALQMADSLRAHGIECSLKPAQADTSTTADEACGAIQLWVWPEQKAKAEDILHQATHRLCGRDQRRGEHCTWAGALTAMAGILTSWAELPMESGEAMFFPYAMAALGGTLFLKGLMTSREAEDQQRQAG